MSSFKPSGSRRAVGRPSGSRRLDWRIARRPLLFFLLPLLALVHPHPSWAAGQRPDTTPARQIAEVKPRLEQGQATRTLADLRTLANRFESLGQTDRQAAVLIEIAEFEFSLGQYRTALDTLQSARRVVGPDPNRPSGSIQIALANAKAVAHTARREFAAARAELQTALDLAQRASNPKPFAALWNNLGNVEFAQGNFGRAFSHYTNAIHFASLTEDNTLSARSMVNAAGAAARIGRTQPAEQLCRDAIQVITGLPPGRSTVTLWNSLTAILCRRLAEDTDPPAAFLELAAQTGDEALRLAERIGDTSGASFALGYRSRALMLSGRFEEALRAGRQAVFQAQQAGQPHALYQWEWQSGRALDALGRPSEAIDAYRRGVATLQPIRTDAALQFGNSPLTGDLRSTIGDLYFALADLLFQRARQSSDPALRRRDLVEIRDTLELYRTAELENYFQDECVHLLRAKTVPAEEAAGLETSVIYIVPLDDRTELLYSLPAGLATATVAVSKADLFSTVARFRQLLEKRTTYEYLVPARELYDLLVRPLLPDLERHRIRTLIFVPDGLLRTIPLAALNDGRQYLIEQFAVAVIPGVTLMDPRPLERRGSSVLVTGLTEAVQEFPPLPYVGDEVRGLAEAFSGDLLIDAGFQTSAFREHLIERQYALVHIASHAELSATAGESFLLTYDSRIGLDALEQWIRPGQFRGRPVELLTLSACQTAAGDDRAALGLAGVAVKSGARAALATLWFVNDQASAILLSDFYRVLLNRPEVSKAQALQSAQRSLLASPAYRHPCYWAPYLIIGNWL